jgi:hypothetical protein
MVTTGLIAGRRKYQCYWLDSYQVAVWSCCRALVSNGVHRYSHRLEHAGGQD